MTGSDRVSLYNQFSFLPYVFLALLAGIFVAVAPLMVAAGVILGTIGFVLTLIRIEFGLAFLAFAVPFGSLASLDSDVSGLSATEPLVVLVTFAWMLRIVAFRDDRLKVTPIFVFLIGFLGALLLSMSTALSLSLSLKELLKWSGFLVVFIVAANTLKTRNQITIVLLAIIAAGTIEALIGWYQFFARVGPEGFVIGGGFMRAYGTFGQPNPFAGYLALVVPLAYALLLDFDWIKSKPVISLTIILGVTAIITVAIVMSLSRGAWLGLALGFFVVASLRSRKAFVILLALLLVIIILLTFGVTGLLPPEISQRFADIGDYFGIFDVREVIVTQENWAIVERMASWQAGWNMFQDNVWLGLGPGNFAAYYLDYALPGWEETGGGHAHNYYLNLLAETGVIGLMAYLAFIFGTFLYVLRCYQRTKVSDLKSSETRVFSLISLPVSQGALALGAIGVLVALHVHNFFDNLYVHGIPIHVGMVLGLVVAAGAMQKEWSAKSRV